MATTVIRLDERRKHSQRSGVRPSVLYFAVFFLICCGCQRARRDYESEVPELSGLVKSRRYENVFWAHGDSGNDAELYAIDGRGKTLARFEVQGADNHDWEDLAIDDQGRLYIGDIGNNYGRREDLCVYVVREPDLKGKSRTVRVERRIDFRYPDRVNGRFRRSWDAEALIALNGRLYLFTKDWRDAVTRLYRFPENKQKGRVTLEKVADIDLKTEHRDSNYQTTAADVRPDGAYVALLTYRTVYVYAVGGPRLLASRVGVLPALQKAGFEALAWDGDQLVIGAESGALLRVEPPGLLPNKAEPSAAETPAHVP